MRSTATKILGSVALLVVASALPVALAHGDDEGAMDMGGHGDMGGDEPKPDPDSYPETYFAHPEHVNAIYAHIGIMVIGWVFMLPTGTRPVPVLEIWWHLLTKGS